MNRCWMLGTLLFGSFIALGRNIRLTVMDGMKSPNIMEGILFGSGAPVNEGHKLRRILQESAIPLYQFVYFEEQSLSRERHLFREVEDEVMAPVDDLLKRADEVLESSTPSSKYNMHPDSAAVADFQQSITLLGIAYFLTGADVYAEQAVEKIRHNFVNSKTALSPDDLYESPLRSQIYQLLDAMQMVQGYLSDHELPQLREWFTNYLHHFELVGKRDKESKNHTGLYYDIEDMAVSHFVRDDSRMAQIWKRSLERLSKHVSDRGTFPQEVAAGSAQCEHYRMYTLQGWWTLARLFSNALGETLWTAEREALCRASEQINPFLRFREECDDGSSPLQKRDDRRWWPLVVDTMRHCPASEHKRLRWREWMSQDSKNVPTNLYDMPRVFDGDTGIAPFWNLGLKLKKTGEVARSTTGASGSVDPEARKVEISSNLHIPAKLIKAAEQDAEMAQRLSRVKRWYGLGQGDISERMIKKALKDLRSTQILWQPKDIIPQAMLDAEKIDPTMAERVSRIRRWHFLKQTSIVERMIKKAMSELVVSAEDRATVALIAKQSEDVVNKPSFLRSHQGSGGGRGTTQSSLIATTTSKETKKSLVSKLVDSATTISEKSASMQIPPSLVQQSQTDGELAKRIHRIHRWKKLDQHDIADKMIKKLLASTEDQTF